MEKMLNLSAQKTKPGKKKKLAREQLENILSEFAKASEEAEKYKDADQRCEELGVLDPGKTGKAEKIPGAGATAKERIELKGS